MHQKAFINKDILLWARNRAQLDPETVARGITSDHTKLIEWENGEDKPSLNQARKLAERLRIPFGYLFLSEQPREELPIPDLRTRTDKTPAQVSPDLLDQIGIVLTRQNWYREYRVSLGYEPVQIVGAASLRDSAIDVAKQIRETFGLAGLQAASSSWEGFLTAFVRKTEELDVLVMRSGVVGNNSRRPLNVDEFQGFAVSDPYAPIIFLNSKDFVAARIFTLAHELAHIWVGESGLILFDQDSPDNAEIDLERWCNEVAANALVPGDELLATRNEVQDLSGQVDKFARAFRVSSTVILRRFLELELITRDQFFTQLAIEREKQTFRVSGPGGDQINNIVARGGRKFTESVVTATLEGRVDYAVSVRLLGVKAKTLQALADRMEWR